MKIIPQDTNSKGFDFDVFHRRLNKANGIMKHTLTGGGKDKPTNAPKPISGGPVKPISGTPVKPVLSETRNFIKTDFTGAGPLDKGISTAVSAVKGLKTAGNTLQITKTGKRAAAEKAIEFHESGLKKVSQDYKNKGAELDSKYAEMNAVKTEYAETNTKLGEIDAQIKQLTAESKKGLPTDKRAELETKLASLTAEKDTLTETQKTQKAALDATSTEFRKIKSELF
jgi:hypothetical protein